MLKAPLPFNLLNPLPWFMIVLLVIVNPSWKDQMCDMKLDHSQKDYPRSEDLGLLSITSTPETPGIIQDIPTMKIEDNLIQLVQQTYWSSRFSMQQPRGCYMRLSCVFNPQHQNWHQLRYPKKTRWFNQVLERYAHQSSIIRWKCMFPEPTWPHAALFCLSHSTHLLPFAHPLWDETTKSSRWQAPRHPRSIRTASARQCHAVTFTSKIWVEALALSIIKATLPGHRTWLAGKSVMSSSHVSTKTSNKPPFGLENSQAWSWSRRVSSAGEPRWIEETDAHPRSFWTARWNGMPWKSSSVVNSDRKMQKRHETATSVGPRLLSKQRQAVAVVHRHQLAINLQRTSEGGGEKNMGKEWKKSSHAAHLNPPGGSQR